MKTYRLYYNYENDILNSKCFYSETASGIVKKVKELNLKYYDIDFYDSFLDNYVNVMTRKDLSITINHAFFKAIFKNLL